MMMEFLDFNQIIITITLLSLVPAIILLINYIKTALVDFLLFSMFFFSLAITSFFLYITNETTVLILAQIGSWSFNFTIFVILLHSFNIRPKNTKVFKVIGYCWFIMLEILIFFFKIIIEPRSAYIFCNCLKISVITDDPSFMFGAGIVTPEGYIIYSTGYPLISTLFQLFTAIILLFSYIKLNPIIITKRVKNIKLLMIFAWTLLLIYTLGNLPWIYMINPDIIISISDFCLLLSLFLIAFVSIRFPESLLISQIQILKAKKLFTKFQEESQNLNDKKKLINFYENSFSEYIKSIPAEFLQFKQD